MADRLARDLAARGIDAIARQGTMTANGRAIGVLGTGIDVCYPKQNRKLYEKVLERGAILSEFPLGTHPAPENFPIRNRRGGHAAGRDHCRGRTVLGVADYGAAGHGIWPGVFGVPGNVAQEVSFAPNLLTKQGAKLVMCAEDMIEELPTPVRAALTKLEQPEAEQRNLLVAQSLTGSGQKNLCVA